MERSTIRKYDNPDLEQVVELLRSNIPKYFVPGEEAELREFLQDHAAGYYVAEFGGEIVGSGGIAPNRDETVSLCWGMIRSDHLGTGKGREITEFRIRKASEEYSGWPIVIKTSQHTQGFYEKFGFRLTKHIADGFSVGIDLCEMRLLLR